MIRRLLISTLLTLGVLAVASPTPVTIAPTLLLQSTPAPTSPHVEPSVTVTDPDEGHVATTGPVEATQLGWTDKAAVDLSPSGPVVANASVRCDDATAEEYRLRLVYEAEGCVYPE